MGTAELLLGKDPPVYANDKDNNTPLHLTDGNIYTSTVELFLKSSASIGAVDKDGYICMYL